MGSYFAQKTTTNPCSLLSRHYSPFGDMYEHETPPAPPQNTPFFWPDFESGQNELLSGQNGPHLGKIFEKWAKLF